MAAVAGRDASGVGTALIARQDAKSFLEASGVTFPPGASATYITSTSRLVVRKHARKCRPDHQPWSNSSRRSSKQVEIESKFIEITQSNLKELSFDWTLGQANLPGSAKTFISGGTSGTGRTISSSDFPFSNGGNVIGGHSGDGG